MLPRFLVVILSCALVLGSSSCSLFSQPSPQDAFHAFADALQRKDSGAAAAGTDDPNAATASITSVFDGMGKNAGLDVAVAQSGDDENSAPLAYSWTFGPGKTLRYDAVATAVQSGDDWHVHWSTTALHPKLQNGMTFSTATRRASSLPSPIATGNRY